MLTNDLLLAVPSQVLHMLGPKTEADLEKKTKVTHLALLTLLSFIGMSVSSSVCSPCAS